MNKAHKKETLMGWKKEALVEHIMCLEHNIAAMDESFVNQYRGCVAMIASMDLLNEGLKTARMLADVKGE